MSIQHTRAARKSIAHTPGPWIVDDGGEGNHEVWAPESDSKDAICYVGTEEEIDDNERYAQHAANAKLIAAAPELLEALYRAEDGLSGAISSWRQENGDIASTLGALKAVRAAIAKATK